MNADKKILEIPDHGANPIWCMMKISRSQLQFLELLCNFHLQYSENDKAKEQTEKFLHCLKHWPKEIGFFCVHCRQDCPRNYFWYVATNTQTGERFSPLCAHCVRGDTDKHFVGPPWKHEGPFSQPVKL